MPERKLSGWVSQKSGKEILLLVSILFLTKLIGTEAAPSLSSATRSETALAAKTLTLGLREAVLLGLQNNQALRVEKLTPAVRKTYEEEDKARFDPTLEAGLSLSRQHAQTPSRTTGALTGTTSSQVNLSGGFSRLLPGGTSFVTELSTAKDWSSLYSNLHTTRLGLTVTQALLQGADVEANLARLRQARLDSFASEYELQALAENIVAEIEKTYWQYALARREIEIYQDSLKLAEQQLKETEEKISVGKLAEIELAAAQAEVALRREALINATSKMESIRLQLLRLLNPPDGSWESEVILKDLPAVPQVKLDAIENHCALALRLRPELQQARLSLQRNEVELVKTKNGLLPKLDFFLTLGKTGYANSFGGSLQDITGKGYEVAAGLAFQWPVGNRQAKAQYQ
ncbi:MAG TPA: TolC family protein, partial [bacterium]|nr:TolC family protein [bacterium]